MGWLGGGAAGASWIAAKWLKWEYQPFRQAAEDHMSMHWKPLVVALMFVAGVAPAVAQGAEAALQVKADGGDAAAQVQMGDSACAAANASGAGAKQLAECYKTAAGWYRRAAEQGFAAGQVRLAGLYRDGRGVARDMALAADWYRKAAEAGDAGAQGTLGVLYSMGQGVAQSYLDAYYWFDLAARVKGPDQEKYATYRQMSGEHITVDELADEQERAAKWVAAHPR
jgi:TPR repeat protein